MEAWFYAAYTVGFNGMMVMNLGMNEEFATQWAEKFPNDIVYGMEYK